MTLAEGACYPLQIYIPLRIVQGDGRGSVCVYLRQQGRRQSRPAGGGQDSCEAAQDTQTP
jgi:hypothetical protein